MREIWNFSAGPAKLPTTVLKRVQTELDSYHGSGVSIMEMSHRSEPFSRLMEETKNRLRNLLKIPDEYTVLFLQGGASLQFAMVPMNLKKKDKAAYIHTGNFSKKAMEEAEKVGVAIDIIGSSEADHFTKIPKWKEDFSGYDYIHITSNNTIEGTTFYEFPDTGSVPLVADMSSNILSEPLDVSKFGLIYAGAQKNLGIAGLTVVIVRKDLLNRVSDLPNILDYQKHAEKDSMYNTPSTFAIYISNLILEWIEDQGGLKKVGRKNREKAALFYDYLDQSEMFHARVQGKDRSIMNIPFVTGNEEMDQAFIRFSTAQGIQNIKGHRSVGGMRASIYNAMPIEGVEKLIQVMRDFENRMEERA